MKGIFNPLFKVTLPGYVEQEAGSPQENDCQVTEVSGENLLVKIFFCHAIVALKVIAHGDRIPNAPRSWVLCEILAKFWKFCCHRVDDSSDL
jgi:hypothetical protein